MYRERDVTQVLYILCFRKRSRRRRTATMFWLIVGAISYYWCYLTQKNCNCLCVIGVMLQGHISCGVISCVYSII